MNLKRLALVLAPALVGGAVLVATSPAWAASTSLTPATVSGSDFSFSCSTDTAGRLVARSWQDPNPPTPTVQDASAVVAAGGNVTQTRDGLPNTRYGYRCLLYNATMGGLITRTPTPQYVTTGADATRTLFGSNAEGLFRSSYNPIKVQRVFFGGAPGTWGSGALAAGIPTVVSFKYMPEDVLAGRHDAALRSWFASMPTDRRIDWSYWHEPENEIYVKGAFTAAQYRAAFIHIHGISKEPAVVKFNVFANVILMAFTLWSGSGRNWQDVYPDNDSNRANGSPYVDVLSWDLYWGPTADDDGRTPEDDLFERFGPGSDRDIFAVNLLTGDPIAVGEVGYDHDGTRPGILRQVEQMFRGKAVYVCYFDLDKPPAETGDHALSDAASQAEWRRIVAA
jgi:hypothetical protein